MKPTSPLWAIDALIRDQALYPAAKVVGVALVLLQDLDIAPFSAEHIARQTGLSTPVWAAGPCTSSPGPRARGREAPCWLDR